MKRIDALDEGCEFFIDAYGSWKSGTSPIYDEKPYLEVPFENEDEALRQCDWFLHEYELLKKLYPSLTPEEKQRVRNDWNNLNELWIDSIRKIKRELINLKASNRNNGITTSRRSSTKKSSFMDRIAMVSGVRTRR